jgi:HSP20 family protein
MFKNKETLPALLGPNPFFRTFANEFDRLFEDRGWPIFFTPRADVEQVTWRPEIEIFELENMLKIYVDLPGIKKEEVKIELAENILTISGERKREKEEKKGAYLRSERVYGTFLRTIPLPETVKLDEVKALFTDGVLEIVVPIAARVELTKRIVPIVDVPVVAKKTAA